MSPFELSILDHILPEKFTKYNLRMVNSSAILSHYLILFGLPGQKFIEPLTYMPNAVMHYRQVGFGESLFEEMIENELQINIQQAQYNKIMGGELVW